MKKRSIHSSAKGKKRWIRMVSWILGLLAALLLVGIIWLKWSIYPAHSRAVSSAQSANVTETRDYIKFDAENEHANLVFEGGALVEIQAYSYLAEQLSQRGVDVYLLKYPFNMAIFNSQKVNEVIKKQQLTHVYLAGHSMGGAMVAQNLPNDAVDGLIFLAAYPDKKNNLSKTNLPVLSITATEDKVLNWDNYREAKKRLPAATDYVSIQGGNHGGFGLYGPQKKDGTATIQSIDQQEQIIQLIADFIQKAS